MIGPIVRGVGMSVSLQAIADEDPEAEIRACDFHARWALYAFLRAGQAHVGLRHEAATRRDQSVPLPADLA